LDDLKFTFIDGGTPQQKTDLLQAGKDTGHATSIEEEEFLPENYSAPAQYNVSPAQSAVTEGKTLAASTALVAQAESITVLPQVRVKTTARPKVTQPASKLKIISRSEWGADESLRLVDPSKTQNDAKLVKLEDDYYTKFADELKVTKTVTTDDSGHLLTWPLTYPETIKKIVIHHTATTKDLDDPMKAIRDIYYWHAISKGWGDIGYNYIIDPQGNIYEGRFGGEMVVGAHAGRANHGSIGIAILGNYEENDPPEAVVKSLTALIKEKAQLYHIDTEGSSLFRGQNYPNVMGHRDIMSTTCPGGKLYDMLPIIRKMAKVDNVTSTSGSSVSSDYDFAFADSAPVVTLDPKGLKNITFNIKNKGTSTWGADTYFQIRPNQTSRQFLRNADEILSSKVGKEVKPGDSVQVQMLTFANSVSGSSLIDLFPVINGKQKVERYLSFGLQVKTPAPQPKYDYELLSVIYSKNEFKKGDIISVTVKLRNKGVSIWQKAGNNRLMLGADKPKDHKNVLLETPSSRLSGLQEDLVKSGEIGTFVFNIKVPSQDGLYREYFTPVVEGVQWMNNHNSFIQLKIGNSDKLMTQESDDAEGDIPVSNSFLKPASQGAGQPETITKFSKSTSTSSTSTSAPVTSNPTPTGSSTVNIASTKLDVNAKPRAIRVDLAYRGNPAVISADGDFSLYEGVRKIKDFVADQKVTVNFQNGTFKISSGTESWNVSARPRFVPKDGTIMRIDSWERRNDWGDHANNNEFRGVLEGIIYNNELHFVNELNLEDYLKGISEEPVTEPDEKIKTIMVIARTYARFYMDVAKKFPGAPFDLNDDPNYSQKYTGYSFEKRSPKIVQMVEATAGKYVTYQGKLIKTPFFSKSDGKRTLSAQEKWGWTDTPFLASVDDSLCQSTAFSGHGVGLSGCGATAMAKLGKTFDQIIKYYYQGTEITQSSY
jgi:hypothetical protein